jgi:YVTN family beta-propeller protein
MTSNGIRGRHDRRTARLMPVGLIVIVAAACVACTDSGTTDSGTTDSASAPAATAAVAAVPEAGNPPSPTTGSAPTTAELPYAHTRPTDLTATARAAKPMVYVPNQQAGTVQVIDPTSYKVVATYPVARSPEHVVPSPDLTTLWVNSDAGNTLTAIDPTTGARGNAVPVDDPYNLYFTPDGSAALVMAERLRRIDVRDPRTMALRRSLPVPCRGINHADFTADLTSLLVSCEFTGQLLVLDAKATTIRGVIDLNTIATPGATSPMPGMGGPMGWLEPGASSMPQDVRLAPDGIHLLVADMLRNGVWVIDAATMTVQRFQPTGKGAHGIYPSRDASRVYVSNRDEGSVSVLDAGTLSPIATWRLPGGGSPDMGGVTADGTQLWLSGRYNAAVYVIDTTTGALLHTIAVRSGPHGLLVWPQPGRYSLGHTGNMR